MVWKLEPVGKIPKISNPVFIEGLPGIGNIGKIAVDFIVDEIKAKKIYSFFSYSLPHSVFVNEKNLVELPTMELFHKKVGKTDMLFLAGDIQPIDEESSYELCEMILDLLKNMKAKHVVTIGGIGLQHVPKKAKVYCTGNSKEFINDFRKGMNINDKLYGVVGPIVGVTGLLVGLAHKRKIPAIALLAETFGHPMYLGVKGAKEVLRILDKKYGLKVNLKSLDKEIEAIEKEVIKKTEQLTNVSKQTALKKLKGKISEEVSYIG